jgi:tetratricopeptide (TPR) repeat protein
LCAVAWVACAWGAAGCEPTAKEKLVEARTALNAGDADKAEAALDAALAKDASLVEAERIKWRVFLLRKQYDKAEQALKDFSEKQGLGKEGLPGDKKSLKRLVESDYNELYRLWAEGVGADSPTKYREVLEAGLARDPKDPELNRMLVAHLESVADASLKKGDKVGAAEAYEALLELRTMPATRKEARTQAVNLRKEIFMDAARTRFDGEVKPKLGDLYDASSGTILYAIEAEVDRALNPRKPEDVTQAQAIAVAALGAQIQAHVRQIGGLGPEVELIKQPNGIKIIEESFERGVYKVKGSVPVSGVLEYAHAMRNRADRAAAKEGEPKKVAGEEGAPEASPDAGAQPPAEDAPSE